MPTVNSMRNRIAHHLYKSGQIFKSLIYIVSELGIHYLPKDIERMKTPSKEVAFWAYTN